MRNHTKEGTFRALQADLARIAALGTDIIWLMPIHPTGQIAQKGTYGCPYSIRDYRAVNEEYGTMEDFCALTDAIHALGMRVIIDVVYNHTSRDSVLLKEHPEYFYHNEQGEPINRIPDWEDVIDLNYTLPELREYQIETLVEWAKMVDGFRCDVAPMVPVDFWAEAVDRVAEVRPDAIWLAEVGGPGFMRWLERLHCPWWCESELLTAFDMTYDYDGYDYFGRYLADKIPLSTYTQYLCNQNGLNSRNYVKLRFLENHDQPRAKQRIPNDRDLDNCTAFSFFLFGPALIYAGQEYSNSFTPSLFEKQPIDRKGKDRSALLTSLAKLKSMPLFSEGYFDLWANDALDTAVGSYRKGDAYAVGVFRLKSAKGSVEVPLPDGEYRNEIDGKTVRVRAGKLNVCHCPIIVYVNS